MKVYEQKMKWPRFLLIFRALSMCACLFLFLTGCSGKAVKIALHENERLQAENERLNHEIVILRARTEDLIRSQPGLSDDEREELQKKGLNPDYS